MSTPIRSLGNKTPEQLRVTELREELKKRGANFKGLKKDLVERLDEVLRQEAAETEADGSKKSSPEQPKDEDEEEEEEIPIENVTQPSEEEDAAVKVVELEPSEPLPVDDLEPNEPLQVDDLKSGTVEPVSEEDDNEGKEAQTDRSQMTLTEPELVPKYESAVMEPLGIETATSMPEVDSLSSSKFDEHARTGPESAPAVEVMDEEGKAFEGEPKVESEDMKDENFDSGKSVEAEDKIMVEVQDEAEPNYHLPASSTDAVIMEASEATKLPEMEVQNEAEQLEPVHRPRPASSTDAVIIEASEAERLPAENASLSEGLRSTAYGEGDVEEEEKSVVEETGGEVTEMMTTTVETVSVVTETTVVTTETVVVNEMEAEGEASFTQRSSDMGTLSIEGKVDEEAIAEQNREKDEEGMEVEQDAKTKDSKPMEIDSDNLAGVKRKDGEESRQQEPTKRQRRWNSDKSIGASADLTSPKVITTDTSKETVVPEGRVGSQAAPVAPSPSTTASSTPKASAASSSFEKLTPSRPVLSRTDLAVNGEVDKKRVVPPPTRSPTLSLKIDRFVRPFTIKAVRELLEQTGTVKEMWMDQIKTHCYVTYSSVEEATATRNALYHVQWPVAGGKLLTAEFVEPEEVKSRVDGINDRPAPTPVTTPHGSSNSSTQVAGPMGLTPPAVHVPTSALPPPPPLPPPPRERPALLPKKEPEPPIPTLDDLFKKTRTKPQIYFLPLTEEQVANNLRNKQPVSKAPLKA